jgi:CHAD domain-containing protein
MSISVLSGSCSPPAATLGLAVTTTPAPVRVPRASVSDVARGTVSAKLKAVELLLKRAVHVYRDADLMHDLRVSCRRALATLDVFRPVLKRRRASAVRTQLKKILSVTANIRDCDVFLRHVRSSADQSQLQGLAQTSRSRQRKANEAFLRLGETLLSHQELQRNARRLTELLKRNAPTAPGSFSFWALGRLGAQAESFFASGLPVVIDAPSLHRLRLRTKALRYTIETLDGALPADFADHLLPVLESLQTRLGDLHDEAQAVDRIEKELRLNMANTIPQALQTALAARRAHLRTGLQMFLQWWTPDLIDDLLLRTRTAVGLTKTKELPDLDVNRFG